MLAMFDLSETQCDDVMWASVERKVTMPELPTAVGCHGHEASLQMFHVALPAVL